jgi:putative ABC transport system permease protein
VPAVVVKTAAVAGAYALRAQYRQGGTMALFPAEVLVSLYRTLGDVRDVLVVASWLNDLLILAAVTILLLALAGLRRRRYAILRALGASRSYILLTVWLGASLVLTAGCVAGLALGGVAAWLIGHFVQQRTGLALAVAIGLPEVISIVGLIVVVSLLALLPASVSFRAPVGDALR